MTTMSYIIGKVKGFHIANMTLAKWKLNYDRVRKEFWQVVGVLCAIILIVWMMPSGSVGTSVVSVGTSVHGSTVLRADFVEEGCAEYERLTGRKIYPKGREFIRNGAIRDGLTTVADVVELIRKNEKFMWKDAAPLTVSVRTTNKQ